MYDFYSGLLTQDIDAQNYEIKPGLDHLMSEITEFPVGLSYHFALNNKIFSHNRIPPQCTCYGIHMENKLLS
jgi:hypothetical protein